MSQRPAIGNIVLNIGKFTLPREPNGPLPQAKLLLSIEVRSYFQEKWPQKSISKKGQQPKLRDKKPEKYIFSPSQILLLATPIDRVQHSIQEGLKVQPL